MATYTFTTTKGKTIKVNANSQADAERRARDTAAETGESIGSSSRTVNVQPPAPTYSAPPAQVATPSFTRNLAPGASGSDVTSLQQFLISKGYSIPSGATGYYGEQTKSAVAAWQRDSGVDTAGNPGFFGPRSQAALKSGGTPAPTPTPEHEPKVSPFESLIASDPFTSEQLKDPNKRAQFDSMPEDLQAIYLQTSATLSKAISAGKVVNPDVEITPEKSKEFLDQAVSELEPYYQEKYTVLKSDVDKSAGRLIEDFRKGVDRRKDVFKKTLEDTAQAEAESGTVYSSGRIEREARTVDLENQALSDAETTTARGVEDIGRTFEKEAGSDRARTLNIPGLESFRATPTGYSPGPTRSLFQPFTSIVGNIAKERDVATKTRQSELEKTYRAGRVLDLSTFR